VSADAAAPSPARRLAEWARRTPGEVAFRSPAGEWTYAALDRRATAIARALAAGEAGDRVAFLAGSDGDAVAALLGAIRARRAAVPLDPAQPAARLARIVESSGAVLVAAAPEHLPLAESIAGRAAVVPLGPGGDAPGAEVEFLPGDLAVLLFTSGSTGAPKGIGRTVGVLAAGAARHAEEFALGPPDRILLLGAVTFSANVSQVLAALWVGASLRSYPVEREGLTGLAAWMREERVTIAHFVPTLFRRFAAILRPDDAFPDLRLLRLSGETIRATDVALWRRHFPRTSRLSLSFATTEASRICARTLTFDEPVTDGAVGVGWPVPGVRVDLLDEEGRPVPEGEPGEIVVTGRSVLREYWDDPGLTARQIAPVPGDPDARAYRTGDVGRWSAEGGLIHLGRKDLEVKIRGIRVHLSEVEAALASMPGLGEAVAAGRPDETGGARLVAYVAGDPRRFPPRSEIRRHLRSLLPEAAVPAAFVPLADLPRTPTGKVNRLALPDPTPDDYAEPGSSDPPRDALEERLMAIWRRILPARVQGIRESFFDLGGDSLRGAEMLAAIESELGRRLPLPILLDAPTVERLAAAMRAPAAADERTMLVALRASGTRAPFFCVPGGNGPGFNFRTIARLLGEDQPFYAFHVLTETGEPSPGTIEEWAERFLGELRRVQPSGPYRLGGHSFGGTVAWEMATRLAAAGETVEVLALLDTFAPGYPPAAPAVRRAAGLWERFRTLTWRDRAAAILGKIRRRLRPSPLGEALRAYAPPPLPIPVVLFRARDQVARAGRVHDDPDNGWRAIAGANLRTFPAAGTHDTLIEGEGAAGIARVLGAILRGEEPPVSATAKDDPRGGTAGGPIRAAS